MVIKHSLHGRPVTYCYDHAVVISIASPDIIEIPSFTSSFLINSPMETWGYCKSFLSSWCSNLSATSIECGSYPGISCGERITRNITGIFDLDVGSDSYLFKNGVSGLVVEHSEHGRTVHCATCPTDEILPIANVFAIINPHTISFSENICSAFLLILEAPWFHFITFLWLLFRLFTTLLSSQKEVSRFRLLVRLRMALGRLHVQRLSNVEILSLRNSPACLHRIEPSCGIPQSRSLSIQMANASVEDLSYLCRASDIMSLYVEQVIAKRSQDTKKERRRMTRVQYFTTNTAHCDIVYNFLLIILILSVFEKSEENVRNVMLYGVPGLQGVSISEEGTYSTIRKEILQFAPNLPEFYFVHRGVIIKDEDVGID